MTESDKVNMTINIGGEHIPLTIDFNLQDAVRDAEKAASDLFNTWRLRWPNRTDKEILAMVAYQFAYYYQDLLERQALAAAIAEDTASLLDILLEGKNPDKKDRETDDR